MKYNQGFVTWSTKSLTQGEANGQGTVASSTSDQRFNQNLLAIESLFVRENSDEPVPFVMYARGFERFVSLGISPGKNYPGITTQNLLVHILVPETEKPWEAFVGCLVAPAFRGSLDDQDYMRTDLPVLEVGENDSSFFNLADILSEFGFNEDKNRLACFLQRSIGAILRQSGALHIMLPNEKAQELRRQAARITWLIAMAMPKRADNTMRYVRNISYSVGTKYNVGKANVIYAGSGTVDEERLDQVVHLDFYMEENEEEKILPVFRALSDKIVEFGRKNEDFYQLIRELGEGRDPVWGDLQKISDARYSNSNNLTALTLNMSYIYWLLEDPENRGHVSYDDIKDYYSGLLVQTKLGKKWHETMLFNYLKQENTPDYQSELALWKEVLSPALKRRDQFDKETWDKYLEMIFWCMKYGYKNSSKNHYVFLRQLKNDEDSEKTQLALYDRTDIIVQELAKIETADDYRNFMDKYRLLCQRRPEVEQRAFAPVSFKLYIDHATNLKQREEISRKNLPDFGKKVEKYIEDFFTAERIGLFFKDELERTEDRYLSYAYKCLYGYLEYIYNFWDDLKYQEHLLDEMRKRNISCDDPGFFALLNRKYCQELVSCTIDDLFHFPDNNQIDHLNNNKVNWYPQWQGRVFNVLQEESLTSSQFLKVCDACIEDNGLFSYLGDQETYKRLFRILLQAANQCVIDQSFSGESREIDALRMKVQITWKKVCESKGWELEIAENDYDAWDWKCEDDFWNCYAAWLCLTVDDRDEIFRFPEPQYLRYRISNQNFLRVYTIIRDNGNVRDTLNRERLENRYYIRNKAGNSRQLYLNDVACTLMLTVITDKFGSVKEFEIAINESALRNILLNLAWVLSLFDTDVYWVDNDEYRKLTPDQRRMHFYESLYHNFSQSFDTFIRLYNKYYQNPNRGEEYIKLGWRYNKLHEDYNEYQRNSEQINDDITKGVYNKDWRRIILNLGKNISQGERDEMASADVYKDTQNVFEEIQCSLNCLKKSLENESRSVREAKEKNNADFAKVSELQQELYQVRTALENEQKSLEAEGDKLKQKEAVGKDYTKGTSLEFASNITTEPIYEEYHNLEKTNPPVAEPKAGNDNPVITAKSVSLGNYPQEQRQRVSFKDKAMRSGKIM